MADDDVDVTRHLFLARLGGPTVGMMLLPADPLAPVLDFDDSSLAMFPE